MLYPSQEIEIFLEGFKQLINTYPHFRSSIKLSFPGILFIKDVAQRVRTYMVGYEDVLSLSERISRNAVLDLQGRAHLLLMVSHKDAIGIPSSKIYEYLGLGKPVLVCPGDGDILNETFAPYNLGHIATTSEEAFSVLQKLFEKYLDGTYNELQPDRSYTSGFARSTQAGVLAKLLDQVSEKTGHSR